MLARLRSAMSLVAFVVLPTVAMFFITAAISDYLLGRVDQQAEPAADVASEGVPAGAPISEEGHLTAQDIAAGQFPDYSDAMIAATFGMSDSQREEFFERFVERRAQQNSLESALETALLPATSTIEIDQQMLVGETYEASLIVERGTGEATLQITQETDQPTAAQIPIRVTDQVFASATSSHLDIELTSPEWQSLATGAAAVWTWTIEPRRSGQAVIRFTLFQKVLVDETEQTVFVENYPRDLEIHVPFWSRVANGVATFLLGPIGILSSLMGLLTGALTLRNWWKNRVPLVPEPEAEPLPASVPQTAKRTPQKRR